MNLAFAARAASVLVTMASFGGAILVWDGAPLSPLTIARHSQDAASNSAVAVANLTETQKSTEALRSIAESVRSQLDTSRRMLATQLEIEGETRLGGAYARDIARGIKVIQTALAQLRTSLRALSVHSGEATMSAERSAAAARQLETTLSGLEEIYQQVIEESRELNRKARGYAEARDGPD